MFLWICQMIFIYTLFILLLHHIYNYLISNFTVPKVKDLAIPVSKYKQVQEILTKEPNTEQIANTHTNTNTNTNTEELYDISELLPQPIDPNQLKAELKQFFSKNKNT